jgi:hypothetical protein
MTHVLHRRHSFKKADSSARITGGRPFFIRGKQFAETRLSVSMQPVENASLENTHASLNKRDARPVIGPV